MKNIHLIPTDKPSRLTIMGEKLLLSNSVSWESKSIDWEDGDGINQHIYITSDEEIKGETICINLIYNCVQKVNPPKNVDYIIFNKCFKKIILTTDQDLINDGAQSIDDEFLEWFVKNPSCEEVEVKKLCQKEVISEWWENLSDEEMKEVFKQTGNFHLGGWGHDIGPTEEDVKDMYLEVHNLDLKKLNFNVYKIITPKENTKRETLEEAAESYAVKDFNYSINYDAFIEGAKWQSKIMYSDEDMVKFSSWILLQDITSRGEGNYVNTDGKIVTVKDLFDQFKKK